MNAKVNNLSPLPFYLTREGYDGSFWDANKWYAGGQQYSLLSPATGIPFFLDVDEDWTLGEIKVFKMEKMGGLSVLPSDFKAVAPDPTLFPGKTWLQVFDLEKKDNQLVNSNYAYRFFPAPGYYYIELSDTAGGDVYVSEVFRVLDNYGAIGYIYGKNIVSIHWKNSKDLECGGVRIPYSSNRGYTNMVSVESTIALPEYVYEEEGEERMGFFYPVKQMSSKKYKFSFIAPEYLCDVVRLIPLADSISIYSDDIGIIMIPTQFNVDISWLEGGHYANVDCEFFTDTVARKIGSGLTM